MSWLLFLDESGHDHKQMPYEVRGGVAIHASRLWSFTRAVTEVERDAFGSPLHEFGNEWKGSSLLDRKRWKHFAQDPPMAPAARRSAASGFLRRGAENAARKKRKQPALSPARVEFSGYGQACKAMADGVFRSLVEAEARLFAVALPRGTARPVGHGLRADHAALFGAYAAMLTELDETGLLVMDEVTREIDRSFARDIDTHFGGATEAPRFLVPAPLFVNSASAHAVRAADLCIYCVNWGFRSAEVGMIAEDRPELRGAFRALLDRLFWRANGCRATDPPTGLVYFPDLTAGE